MVRLQPGVVRDAIVSCMAGTEATVAEITARVAAKIPNVPSSSVRSYLRLNTGKAFEQVGRGRYRLVGDAVKEVIWNSDSGRIRISFNEAALVRYSEQLLDFPHEVVMSVCRPDHEYQQ